jgi:hypothetical protein
MGILKKQDVVPDVTADRVTTALAQFPRERIKEGID